MPARPVTGDPARVPHETRAGYLIARLDRIVSRRYEAVLAEHGLTLAQYTTLSVAAVRPGLSSAQLARRALVTPQGMNLVINALEDAGLVARRRHEGGGRMLRVELTPRGREILRTCDAGTLAIERELLVELDEDQRRAFLAGLQALAGLASGESEERDR